MIAIVKQFLLTFGQKIGQGLAKTDMCATPF